MQFLQADTVFPSKNPCQAGDPIACPQPRPQLFECLFLNLTNPLAGDAQQLSCLLQCMCDSISHLHAIIVFHVTLYKFCKGGPTRGRRDIRNSLLRGNLQTATVLRPPLARKIQSMPKRRLGSSRLFVRRSAWSHVQASLKRMILLAIMRIHQLDTGNREIEVNPKLHAPPTNCHNAQCLWGSYKR